MFERRERINERVMYVINRASREPLATTSFMHCFLVENDVETLDT